VTGASRTGLAVIQDRGVRRLRAGHPWIFASDVIRAEAAHGDVVRVEDGRGRVHGSAFFSSRSKIALRVFRRTGDGADASFWAGRARTALSRRAGYAEPDEAFRVIFGESDGIPGLVVDAYAGHLVVQALTVGAERIVDPVLDALADGMQVASVLSRGDASPRTLEGLPREVRPLRGSPPSVVEVREGDAVYRVDTWKGQKTGAFLDQRPNRLRVAKLARGAVLDVFSYHGSFGLQAARGAERVVAIDSSAEALARARESAQRNGWDNLEVVQGNAFDELRARASAGESWDVVILDPPAFAKGRADAEAARRGYKEINVRAMRLVSPGGFLATSSCSYHLPEPAFYEMLAEAAADSGHAFRVVERSGAGADHPERLGFPESRYLKFALLAREETLE
jgi:23S rRNA (cytosine1962-C5)-methyltransferase